MSEDRKTDSVTNDFKKSIKIHVDDVLNLARRRSICFPAFEIYNAPAGLYDYGPVGTQLKNEVEKLWRVSFVLQNEDIMEYAGTCLTPHQTLLASGHVNRFCDLMVKCTKTNKTYRADKYLEEYIQDKSKKHPAAKLEKYKDLQNIIGGLTKEQITQIYKDLNVVSPDGASFSEAFEYNLMFRTAIGTSNNTDSIAYLRPETAQGIFVNFNRYYEYNRRVIPFGVAQIGLGFRNEIAPRNGLLRVREFQMAEIEYFVDPKVGKTHSRFHLVKNMQLPLWTRQNQLANKPVERELTLKEAVESKIIANECLAYFMALTYQFLYLCGIKESKIRFRQHLETEMAHYSRDCWDAEIQTLYGWIECAGHADRGSYDLDAHNKCSTTKLQATKKLPEPQTRKTLKPIFNKKQLGMTFRKSSEKIISIVESLSEKKKKEHDSDLKEIGTTVFTINDENFKVTKDMLTFEFTEDTIYEASFVPEVIEPSFGLGRLIYCILENAYTHRNGEDPDRAYLAFPARIAPIKCTILPIYADEKFNDLIETIKSCVVSLEMTYQTDSSAATIGRRYARADEIGIPYAFTVDFQSLEDETVTMRERDSTEQIRIPILKSGVFLRSLIMDFKSWSALKRDFPVWKESEEKKNEETA